MFNEEFISLANSIGFDRNKLSIMMNHEIQNNIRYRVMEVSNSKTYVVINEKKRSLSIQLVIGEPKDDGELVHIEFGELAKSILH